MPSLKLTDYKPNFSDPRVRRRVKKVLGYCRGMVKHDTVREIPWKKVRSIFGNRHSNQLAEWLYANLMRQEFFYKVGSHPWSYRVDPQGFAKIEQMFAAAEG